MHPQTLAGLRVVPDPGAVACAARLDLTSTFYFLQSSDEATCPRSDEEMTVVRVRRKSLKTGGCARGKELTSHETECRVHGRLALLAVNSEPCDLRTPQMQEESITQPEMALFTFLPNVRCAAAPIESAKLFHAPISEDTPSPMPH